MVFFRTVPKLLKNAAPCRVDMRKLSVVGETTEMLEFIIIYFHVELLKVSQNSSHGDWSDIVIYIHTHTYCRPLGHHH